MKRRLLIIVALLSFTLCRAAFVEHSYETRFIDEPTMKDDMLQMLADFSVYLKNSFLACAEPNSEGEACGCFRGENTMGNDERGVRPNADLSMVCAFLVKYGRGKVTLPEGITWEELELMARQSLVFAYSTHKANRLKTCKDSNYWGSTSREDHVWESSLWAMSVAFSAFFQWEQLHELQHSHIYQLLKAECNYELECNIPTGYLGDTKAEENGWEADVLAATLGLFPYAPQAPQWFERLREFAVNSHSQQKDAQDKTIIDPTHDATTISDLYRGNNLFDDYTLQNHNYFHTSYQNIVVQELGEAALALKLFQKGIYQTERWKTNALMHNNIRVMHEVLFRLALPDGELAMPNGNDWSLFLYDQMTSYTTNACFLRDPYALLLENRAYQQIKTRQRTTADGSWLLCADVGGRRMGVQAHRVMMTWLMHELLPTADLQPASWEEFRGKFGQAKLFKSQNVVCATTSSRFTCFSWSEGLKSYTGYIAPTSTKNNNIIVPFRAHNTGNFLGWYEVEGKHINAIPTVKGIYNLKGNSYVMNGALLENDSTLDHRFSIYSTPGNAVIYMNKVRAREDVTIKAKRSSLMAISVDEFTRPTRTVTTIQGTKLLDGSSLSPLKGIWANISDELGIVTSGTQQMAFGHRRNVNSINTALFYASFSDEPRKVKAGELVDNHAIVYYSNVTAKETARLKIQSLGKAIDGGIFYDPDSTTYLLVCNFNDEPHNYTLCNVQTPWGNPVFNSATTIGMKGASTVFKVLPNHSQAKAIRYFIKGNGVTAWEEEGGTLSIRNDRSKQNIITITTQHQGHHTAQTIRLRKKELRRL